MSYVTLGWLLQEGRAVELRHFLEKTFVASQTPPPPARLTLLCMWGSLDACVGCGLEDRQGSKPRGNAIAQGIHFHPCMRATPPTSHPSISYRPDEFTVSCISVWQQQPSCVWRLQQAAVCWHPGWFLLLRCWSWARAAHAQRACQCQTWSSTPPRVHSSLPGRYHFCCGGARCQEWAWFAVAFPELQSLESAFDVDCGRIRFLCLFAVQSA